MLPGGSAIYSHFSNLMISTLGLLAFYPRGFTDFRNLSNHPCLLSLIEFLSKAAWSSASPYLTEPELISPSGLAAALRARRCHSCSTYWSMRGNKRGQRPGHQAAVCSGCFPDAWLKHECVHVPSCRGDWALQGRVFRVVAHRWGMCCAQEQVPRRRWAFILTSEQRVPRGQSTVSLADQS